MEVQVLSSAPALPALVVLFGLPGVGKNYIGEILSQQFGFHFWDADEALTPEMIHCIHQEKPFTQKMRNDFFAQVADKIKYLQKFHPHIVVSQALAKEINRKQLLLNFPHAKFILIQANNEVTDQRLKKRSDWVSLKLVEKIREIFETPKLEHQIIMNEKENDVRHITLQVSNLFQQNSLSTSSFF